MRYVFYIVMGYLSGSILFGYILPRVLCHVDVTRDSPDRNPGVANVFVQAGVWVGVPVLLLELAKGFLPVFWAAHHLYQGSPWFALVLAAPVIGHAFPFWRVHGGGKAIAVSFGVLLGLAPRFEAVGILAAFYLFFSLVVVINPHLFRSIATYVLFSVGCFLLIPNRAVVLGASLISAVVIGKHLMRYRGERFTVRFGRAPAHTLPGPEDVLEPQPHQKPL